MDCISIMRRAVAMLGDEQTKLGVKGGFGSRCDVAGLDRRRRWRRDGGCRAQVK